MIAVLAAILVAAMVGINVGFRALLHIHAILAGAAGSTLPYRLGQLIGRGLRARHPGE